MKRILLASTLVFALARPALVGADPGVFAVAEIASFAQLQQDVTALGTAIGQPMLPMGLLGAGQLVASPGMLGIDRDKPIRVALLGDPDVLARDEATKVKGVIALPLADADGASYFQSVLTSATKKSDADGYLTFELSNSPLGDSLEAVVANGYAFLSTDGDIPEADLRAIAVQGADSLAVPGLRGTIRIATSAATLAAPLRKGVTELFDGFDRLPADDPDVVAVRNDLTYLVDLFEQNDTLALGLDFTAGRGLSLWTRADAKPDTDAAAIAASFRVPEDAVLSVLGGEGDAFGIAVAVDPALLGRFLGGYFRLITFAGKLAKASADGDDASAKALQMLPALSAIFEKGLATLPFVSGSFAEAGTFDAEGGSATRFAMGCTDADGLRAASKAFRESLKSEPALDFIAFEDLDSREANGLAIERAKFSYDVDKFFALMGVDGNAELPPPAAAQLEAMRALYGKLGDNTLESAVRDGIFYAAWAPGEAPLDAVLASRPASATTSGPEQAGASPAGQNGATPAGQPAALFADVPEFSRSVVREYVDYAKFIPTLVKTIPAEVVDPEEAEFKDVMGKILSTPDFLGAATWRDGDSLLSVLRFDENVFRDFAAWGQYIGARMRRQWEERMKAEAEDDDGDDEDDPLADLSEEDRKKIGVILDNNGDFDDNK